MRTAGRLIVTAGLFLVIGYLLLPNRPFPAQPPDSVQSLEEADTETPLRRSYFTNFTRQQVLEHYERQLSRSPFLGIPFLTYRLNYPPEDAFNLIRDQTRSTFLEEIVHPFRGSFFVNGFQAKEEKDDIWYRGVHYDLKITVKYVPSSLFIRMPVVFLSFIALYWVSGEWLRQLKKFSGELKELF